MTQTPAESQPAVPISPKAKPTDKPGDKKLKKKKKSIKKKERYEGGNEERGAKIFVNQCSSCHTVEKDGPHGIGPNLHGIFERRAGEAEGFSRYTKANKNSGILWGEGTLFDYLKKPREYIPGTSMNFEGIKKSSKRKDLVAFLKAACSDEDTPKST